ncbi:hypothetical protein CRM22_005547 [Opisthorchis felineus]|uniref:Uncharacterized protein n=1 Tax=Opisthorchis felineus TaxID=147828 RepID=A0A4S2LQM5_OPIFE|nr:hypothetical protein CRM22_005547 [Opisthorchis felineus]
MTQRRLPPYMPLSLKYNETRLKVSLMSIPHFAAVLFGYHHLTMAVPSPLYASPTKVILNYFLVAVVTIRQGFLLWLRVRNAEIAYQFSTVKMLTGTARTSAFPIFYNKFIALLIFHVCFVYPLRNRRKIIH